MELKQIVPLALISFMLSPMLTLFGLLMLGLSIGNNPANNKARGFLFLFGVLCCAAVSLINMTKVPEGDLWDYVEQYKMASRLDYYKFLLEAPEGVVDTIKEPAYYTLVWIMNRVFGGNVNLFLFCMSMLEYSLLIFALILWGKYYSMRLYVVMTGIVVMCFLPYIFVHTLNIVRQSLANSLLIFIMIRHFFYGKRDWILILIMLFIHTTAALFLPLLLIPAFGRPFKKSWIWFAGVILLLLSYQIVSSYFLDVGGFGQESAVGAALGRMERGDSGDYNVASLIVVISVISILYSIFVYAGKILPSGEGLRRFMSTIIILSAFILMMQNQPLVANRFGHYLFSFFPFLLMIFLQSAKVDKSFQFVLCLSTMVFLSYFIYHTVFVFEIEMAGLLPVFFYML